MLAKSNYYVNDRLVGRSNPKMENNLKKRALQLPLILLLILWGFTAIHYSDLPTEIPIHFNAKGVPDGFATRIHCWGMPSLQAFFILD